MKYFKYGKEKLPYKVGYWAMKKWQLETKKGFDEVDEVATDLNLMEPLVYFALEKGFKDEGLEFKLDREDIADILDQDDNFLEFTIEMMDFFQRVAEGVQKRAKLLEEQQAQFLKRAPVSK